MEHETIEAPADSAPPAMLSSQTVHRLAMALSKAQGAFPTIPRDRKVTVTTRPKEGRPASSYTFRYAPLETILEKTRPHLADNELALVQAIVVEQEGGKAVEVLRTTLLHSSGEWMACDVPIFVGTGDNRSQAYASGVTYSRRYGVTLLLCVAADEDDDGNGGEQDGDRSMPDYVRDEEQRYQGSFPRQGGGRSQPPDRNSPRPPQRRQGGQQQPAQQRQAEPARAQQAQAGGDDPPFQDDPLPDFGLSQYGGDGSGDRRPADDRAQHDDDGAVTSPWGEGLTPGQLSMAKSRAEVAGLSDADVLDQVGVVTPANVGEKLAQLKRLADKAIRD